MTLSDALEEVTSIPVSPLPLLLAGLERKVVPDVKEE